MPSQDQDPQFAAPASSESLGDFSAASEPNGAHPAQPPGVFLPGHRRWLPGDIPPYIPPDINVPWGWIDLSLFACIVAIGVVVINVLLILVFSASGISMSRLHGATPEVAFIAVLSQGILFLLLLAYLALVVHVRSGEPFWRTIGWHRLETFRVPGVFAILGFITAGLTLSLLVQLISAVFPPKSQLPMEALFQNRGTAILIMAMSVLLAPVVEETIFRGFIYPVIARTFGITVSAIATGVLFGLLHAPQLWGGWVQIASLVAVGIIFTYARAITRTVFASYLLHISYNSFILCAFLIASHGFKVMPPG